MYKNKFLKFSILFLVVVLFASLSLFGCKEEAAPAEEIEEAKEVEEVVELDEFGLPVLPEPENEVTLDFWMQDWTAALEMMNDTFAFIRESHPNIKVNIIPQPFETLSQKYIPAVMSGTEPDMMFGYSGWLSGVEISELFLKLSPEAMAKEDIDKYIDRISMTYYIASDGEIYGIGWGNVGESWGILVNADLLEEDGINIDDINTWDDLLDVAKKLSRYDDAGNVTRSGLGLTYNWGSAQVWLNSILQLGGTPFNPDTGEWDFNTPEAKEVTQFWADMVLVHKVDDPKIGMAYDNYPKGLCAMFLIGPWIMGAIEADYPEMNIGYILPPPIFPGGQPVYDMPVTAGFVFSKRLEGDKLKAAHIIAREMMVNPKDGIIRLEKWAGAILNKKLAEMIKAGEVDIPGNNDDIFLKVDEFITPYIEDTGSKVDKDYMAEAVYYPEIEKIWLGIQTVDEALQNMTVLANEAERGVAE